MTASPHWSLRRILAAFALLTVLIAIASCGGGGGASDVGNSGGSFNSGGSAGIGSPGGESGAVGGSGDATAGTGGAGDATAGSGGIGGSGGTAGDGSGGTGTADGGSGAGGGGGIGGTGSPSTAGTIHFYLADAPACGFDNVYVTVQKVRIHTNGGAGDADSGWSEVTKGLPKQFDLLTLTNGVFADLGQTSLPAGKYTQVRLVLADNDAANPLANAVVPSGGSATELQVPSGTQSGLKIDTDLDVAAGKTTNLVLDFDACKSVVKRGNSGQYNLKPVITALPLASTVGLRVSGFVAPALTSAATKVSVQVGSVPVRATAPEPSGRFVLYPVPAGSYDLVVTSAGRVTAVMTGVPVSIASPTTVGSAASPIDPPAATMRAVAGTANPSDANVRVLQTLTGGKTIETAWAPVDATTGAFSFEVAVQATVRTAYSANAASTAFVADSQTAGRYTIEASSAGTVRTLALDTNAAVAPVTLTVP